MKKLTISTFLALSTLAFTGTNPSFAQTTAQTQVSGQTQLMLERAFKGSSERDRIQIQSQLSEYGLYANTLDGLWGRNTANALHQAAAMMEQNMGSELNLASSGRARAFLSQFIDGSASAFMWGEGGECDGCGEEQNVDQAPQRNLAEVSPNFRCNKAPLAYSKLRRIVAQAKENANLGNNVAALEFRAQAAYHGAPFSSAMVADVALGGSTAYSDLGFRPKLSPEAVLSCLRFASSKKVALAKVWLARAYVGDESIPGPIRSILPTNIEKARELMACAKSRVCSDNAWQTDFSNHLRIVSDRIAEHDYRQRDAEVSAAAKSADSIRQKCEGLLSLKGICWAQTLDEMKTVFTSQQYQCSTNSLGQHLCQHKGQRVAFTEKEVSFDCEAFDVCSYDYDEVSRFLLDQGIVETMETSRKFITQSTAEAVALSGMGFGPALAFKDPYWLLSNCGKGPKGQELCVEQPEDGEVRLVLRKDTFGAATPSFE
jgi:hypothetical protein